MKKPQWSYKERLPIQDQMEAVVKATLRASEKQIDVYRRKLRKMQLGS